MRHVKLSIVCSLEILAVKKKNIPIEIREAIKFSTICLLEIFAVKGRNCLVEIQEAVTDKRNLEDE